MLSGPPECSARTCTCGLSQAETSILPETFEISTEPWGSAATVRSNVSSLAHASPAPHTLTNNIVRVRISNPLTGCIGLMYGRQHTHLILVRIDQQTLQQGVGRIAAQGRLEVLPRLLDRRETRHHLRPGVGGKRVELCLERLDERGAVTHVLGARLVRRLEGFVGVGGGGGGPCDPGSLS